MRTRRVHFDGMVNFRDLGGLPVRTGGRVRTGRLFRSDSVAYASAVDARRLLHELGVVAVIDLRGEAEVARLGRGPLESAAIRYLPAPITDIEGAAEQVAYYLAMLDQRGGLLVELLRQLTAPGVLPLVFHCEAGCDRTGVLAAALLGLLGVADDDICADYALTAPMMPFIGGRVRAGLRESDPTIEFDDDVPWTPTEATMAATLAGQRERWGGVVGWAQAYGLTARDLAALRAALVEY